MPVFDSEKLTVIGTVKYCGGKICCGIDDDGIAYSSIDAVVQACVQS